jgi:DNA-binding HxlR family transcriptional regulator
MNTAIDTGKEINEIFLKMQQVMAACPDADAQNGLYNLCSLLADKWTPVVLVTLLQGTRRTSELLRDIPGISPKMLTQSLKKLISYKMVERKVYPEVPPHVEYVVTEFGRSFSTPIIAVYNWSVQQGDNLSV